MARSEYSCDCNIVHHDIVDKIKLSMEKTDDYSKLAVFFKAISDETRVKILWALDINELCVCDLCNVLDMTKSAVSHQLSYLRKLHLVKYRKEGKSVYYSLDDYHVREVFEKALEHVRHVD